MGGALSLGHGERLRPDSPNVDLGLGRPSTTVRSMESSGSAPFDALRDELGRNAGLRREIEAALDLNVRRVNPSDRANRFGSGAAVEWIVASAAFAGGVLTVPGGHNANGFDLRDLLSDARAGLWSVKNQTKRGPFRITNGIGGGGRGFVEPTVFLSPALPGIVFGDPDLHPDLAAAAVETSDAVVLPFVAVLDHARLRPECVADCSMPTNPGTGTDDPWLDYVASLLSPERFPRLSQMFIESRPVSRSLSDEVTRLAALKDQGTITPEEFAALVTKLA